MDEYGLDDEKDEFINSLNYGAQKDYRDFLEAKTQRFKVHDTVDTTYADPKVDKHMQQQFNIIAKDLEDELGFKFKEHEGSGGRFEAMNAEGVIKVDDNSDIYITMTRILPDGKYNNDSIYVGANYEKYEKKYGKSEPQLFDIEYYTYSIWKGNDAHKASSSGDFKNLIKEIKRIKKEKKY